jgi:MoxR-like ATPase
MMETQAAMTPVADVAPRLVREIERIIRGKTEAVRLAVACLAARGHLLIEDVPGVGKTTLAKALARTLGGTFRRIQFTADLLPSDILGVTVFDQDSKKFVFQPGPIFANIVLADEINRATPRTQSALLEALSEGQVSAEDETRPLPRPFIVLATQNPQEHFGTYPLPESQMDRFLLRLRLGYPDAESESRILAGGQRSVDPATLQAVASAAEIVALQDRVDEVRVDDALIAYALRVVAETRAQRNLALGVSTRGGMAWVQAARAWALLSGRDYCVPDDLKGLALPALAHRVLLDSHHESLGRTRAEAERILQDILDRVPVPE